MRYSPNDLNQPATTKLPSTEDIDVVIPVHNGARHIRECVSSVLSQTHQPRRIIIVDDGSTDGTVDLVKAEFGGRPAITLHGMRRNCGVSAARNTGLAISDAPFVAFLDADDVWTPDKLALQLEIFKKSDRPLGFVHCSFFLIDEVGKRRPELSHDSPSLLRGNVFPRLLRERNILSGSASAVLIRRDVLNRAGRFNEQLYYGEDWDLWLRLAAISEVDHAPEALVGIRVRATPQAHRGSVDRFLQVMKIYSQWEEKVRGEDAIVKELRRDGFRAALLNLHSLRELMSFYRTLKASKQSLTSDLYRSQPDFWSGIAMAGLGGVYAKASRLIARDSRRHSRGLG